MLSLSKMNSSAMFHLALLFVLTLKCASCLECYTCSSQLGTQNFNNGQDCQYFWNSNWNYDQHRKTQCHHQHAVCAKYIVNHEGMVWVHRSCQPPDICSYLHARYSNPRSQLLECFTCEGNLCNGARTLRLATLPLIFLAAISLFSVYL